MKPLYMEVTRDKYELPLAVADSPYELARMRRVDVTSILKAIRGLKMGTRRKSIYRLVWVDDREGGPMNNYKELIDTLRDLTHGIVRISNGSVLREAADAIETLTTELAEERHRHDRLQDWDRGLTEQGEILKRLINGEWVDSCDVEAALGLTFAECVKRFEMNRIATWNPYPLNGQRVDVQFRIKKGEEPGV